MSSAGSSAVNVSLMIDDDAALMGKILGHGGASLYSGTFSVFAIIDLLGLP